VEVAGEQFCVGETTIGEAVEIRGHAEALRDQEPLMPGMSREIIRIHPDRIISFGLEDAATST
jgi:hypothetical protein